MLEGQDQLKQDGEVRVEKEVDFFDAVCYFQLA